ncbi:MAG: hypothetical protein M1823_005923, partial [Watsoniomyces obsoletus]
EEAERKAKDEERKAKRAEKQARTTSTAQSTVAEVADSQEQGQRSSATVGAAPWQQWSGIIEF